MQANIVCPCQLCSGPIEFEASLFQTGTKATCPHCGAETALFIPGESPVLEVAGKNSDVDALVTCACSHCSEHVEFEASQAGEKILCPHCGVETVLFIPEIVESAPLEKTPHPKPQELPRAIGFVVTTGNDVAGHNVEGYLGIARGIVVRSPDFTQSMFGGLKQIVGGNIESYARVCEQAREDAFNRMIRQAKAMHADALIGVRYDATEFAPGVTEVLAYGTAVKLSRY